jgi:DNA-binding beta-propeller fold protein YncE
MSRNFILRVAPLTAAALILLFATTTLPAQSPYKVVDKWKIGGDGGWDYLLADPSAHRLYITHGPRVEVLDTTTGKPVGAITGLHRTHGIALDTAGKYGFISDGGGNAVVVFDRTSLATVATVPTGGQSPDAIVFEPATQTVWAFNGRSKDVAVIGPASSDAPSSGNLAWKVLATIGLPGTPEFPAVDGAGNVYDNIEDKNVIVHLDAHTLKLIDTWAAGCESPSGLAIDVTGSRLFPVCDGNKMSVVDAKTGHILATPSIGDGPDAAGFSDAHKLAFASSGDGILSVVDASTPDYKTIQSLKTAPRARTMAYDSGADRIYLVTADFGPAPAPTAANPRPRPSVIPGSFTVIVVGR